MHASQTNWGGLVDVSSMYLFAGLIVAYGSARLWRLSAWAFVALFVSLVVLLTGAQATVGLPAIPVFGALLVAALVLELACSRRLPPNASIRTGWVIGAVLAFLAAFAIWLPSRSGGPLCDPDSWLQGHSAWHLLCAVAAGLLYLYYDSEDASATEGSP